jgi:hypothetical protein
MRPLKVSIDDTKSKPEFSVHVLDDMYVGAFIDSSLVTLIKEILQLWSDRTLDFFDKYDEERGRLYFIADVKNLASCIKELDDIHNIKSLVQIGNFTELFHNRHMAQLMKTYRALGHKVDLDKSTDMFPKNHDFNVDGKHCELKTVQSLACVDLRQGLGFEPNSLQDLFRDLSDKIADGLSQVGQDGIIFVVFWCLGTNFLLHEYFAPVLPSSVPNPDKGQVVFRFEISSGQFGEANTRHIVFPLSAYQKCLDELYNYLLKTRLLVERPISIPITPPEIGEIFFRGSDWSEVGTKIRVKC